jgi:hypothetical protein
MYAEQFKNILNSKENVALVAHDLEKPKSIALIGIYADVSPFADGLLAAYSEGPFQRLSITESQLSTSLKKTEPESISSDLDSISSDSQSISSHSGSLENTLHDEEDYLDSFVNRFQVMEADSDSEAEEEIQQGKYLGRSFSSRLKGSPSIVIPENGNFKASKAYLTYTPRSSPSLATVHHDISIKLSELYTDMASHIPLLLSQDSSMTQNEKQSLVSKIQEIAKSGSLFMQTRVGLMVDVLDKIEAKFIENGGKEMERESRIETSVVRSHCLS